MIFTTWFFIWAVSIKSPLGLLIPAIALVIRTSYLQRRLVVGLKTIFIAILVLLLLIIVDPTNPTRALVYALRTALFLLLIQHLVVVLDQDASPVNGSPGFLARGYLIIVRGFRAIRLVLDDVGYASSVRRLTVSGGFARVIRFIMDDARSMAVAFEEFIRVSRNYNDTITMRGGFPHPRQWSSSSKLHRWIYAGDILLVTTPVVLIAYNHVDMFPEWVGWGADIVRGIVSYVTRTT